MPESATFVGFSMVRETNCSAWRFHSPIYDNILFTYFFTVDNGFLHRIMTNVTHHEHHQQTFSVQKTTRASETIQSMWEKLMKQMHGSDATITNERDDAVVWEFTDFQEKEFSREDPTFEPPGFCKEE